LDLPNNPDPAVRKAPHERRKYPRFILRVALRLRGAKSDGTAFDETVSTSVVSAGGFACNCLTHLTEGSLAEVYLLASEQLLGSAKVVRVEPTSPPWYNYGFALTKPTLNWFLVPE
jgi:PilZ domain-containing protein